MKQNIYPPTFIAQYQQRRSQKGPLCVVADVEFTVLVLRICAYSAQFLPSTSQTVEEIGGVPLCNIRRVCNEVGDSLAEACLTLDWKGSATRVQHTLFSALLSSCQGKTGEFWERIGLASQAAQKAGLFTEPPPSSGIVGCESERGTRRHALCSLYILDRCVDTVKFLWFIGNYADMNHCQPLIPSARSGPILNGKFGRQGAWSFRAEWKRRKWHPSRC
jgi:hypothetical protein